MLFYLEGLVLIFLCISSVVSADQEFPPFGGQEIPPWLNQSGGG